MFYADDYSITMTRGDDKAVNVSLNVGDDSTGEVTVYEMVPGDFLTLTVRAIPERTSKVLMQITSLTPRIFISHGDTTNIPYGSYSADIQLTRANGDIITVWPKSRYKGHIPDGYTAKNMKNFNLVAEVTIP